MWVKYAADLAVSFPNKLGILPLDFLFPMRWILSQSPSSHKYIQVDDLLLDNKT